MLLEKFVVVRVVIKGSGRGVSARRRGVVARRWRRGQVLARPDGEEHGETG